MDREGIRARINELSEPEYGKFTEKLVPGASEVKGVRLPALRSLAKEIIKADYKAIIEPMEDDSYEEIMLRGIVIGGVKCDLEEKLQLIKSFVPQIKNWAICDSFCMPIKVNTKTQARYREFIDHYIDSNEEYEQRFAVVTLMSCYLSDEYIDDTLAVLQRLRSDKYYVQMAVAWALSNAFIKQRDKTLRVLKNNELDDFTHNKAIQKIRESFRVSPTDKELMLSLKRK